MQCRVWKDYFRKAQVLRIQICDLILLSATVLSLCGSSILLKGDKQKRNMEYRKQVRLFSALLSESLLSILCLILYGCRSHFYIVHYCIQHLAGTMQVFHQWMNVAKWVYRCTHTHVGKEARSHMHTAWPEEENRVPGSKPASLATFISFSNFWESESLEGII